ncbi:MAG: 4Fe-4S binding protein [Ignavibacteriales bacterium]|nr:4Fe-4S binding protein [Ignavibacteriales bacterium]
MVKRKIIKIDETLCDGCGECITSCPEGALQIIDGKARVVKESFCDGFGACIGECPVGALSIIEAETDEYDENGVIDHIKKHSPEKLDKHIEHLSLHRDKLHSANSNHQHHHSGCPSSRTMVFEKPGNTQPSNNVESQLRQWPIQLHLVSPNATYFRNADIAFVADCIPFAYGNFHNDYLVKYPIAIGCPKLDDTRLYFEKIKQIIEQSNPRSIKILIMEVPCCSGLLQTTKQAILAARADIPVEVTVIGINGKILGSREFDVY